MSKRKVTTSRPPTSGAVTSIIKTNPGGQEQPENDSVQPKVSKIRRVILVEDEPPRHIPLPKDTKILTETIQPINDKKFSSHIVKHCPVSLTMRRGR